MRARFDVAVVDKKKLTDGMCVCARVRVRPCVRACVHVSVLAQFEHVVLEHVGSPAFVAAAAKKKREEEAQEEEEQRLKEAEARRKTQEQAAAAEKEEEERSLLNPKP